MTDDKKEQIPEQPAAPAKKEKKERKYFEVFGDYVSITNTFKHITVFLLFVVVGMMIIVVYAVQKEPLVIRVDQTGVETIKGIRNTHTITKYEVAKFVEIFITKFEGANYYVHRESFGDAFSMCTQSARQKLIRELNSAGVEKQVESLKPKTQVKIESIEIKSDTPSAVLVEVKGNKQTTSYEDENYFEEVIFAGEIALIKVDRSEATPWGILVDNYKKQIFAKK